jgi:transcriptional regulator with XRE-family HTH domain
MHLSVLMTLEEREKLAELIKQKRGSMSKSAFARVLGVSHTAITGWENCVSEPDHHNLLAIAKALGMSLDNLHDFLKGGSTSNSEFDRIVGKIKSMSMTLNQIAVIDHVVSEKLLAIAESAGR